MIDKEIDYSLNVFNAFKNYGTKNVFNGLNINVKSSSM